jgi:hypothetical protein
VGYSLFVEKQLANTVPKHSKLEDLKSSKGKQTIQTQALILSGALSERILLD